jgi:endonuclease/exonuclease/phosphatase family metal-dependent hydrolase
VTITATDSTGRYSTKSFSLMVKNLAPPVNDMFSGALDLATVGSSSTTTGYTTRATMEAGETRPSSPTKDCGIYGVSNSVWFKFTYGGQGGLPPLPSPNAYYNFDPQGSNFDTVLALYEGSSLGTLRQIECSNDNSLPDWNDNLSIPQSKLSVGKTYYVQLTGTGGARFGKYQLHYEPRGLTQPKVMAYNVARGLGPGGLPAVRDTIKALRPDIVLLNEVRTFNDFTAVNGVKDQTEWLVNQTGFPYYKYHRTAALGLSGTTGVAILSRYPISSTDFWHLPNVDRDYRYFLAQWGMLKATIEIDGLTHDVFSTRFRPAQRAPGEDGYDPTDRPENELHHKRAIDIVRSIPSDHAVIFGGDLNASWSGSPWAKEFPANSGLSDALVEREDPGLEEDLYQRADYIYYRGPYSLYQTQHRWSGSLGLPDASDHPYVFAHFLRDY